MARFAVWAVWQAFLPIVLPVPFSSPLNWIETDELENNLILPFPAGASRASEGSGHLRLSPFISRPGLSTTHEHGSLLRKIQGGPLIINGAL
jgi:hypothetical protein